MNKSVILGIDAWYPQVDGVTNVVKYYRENLKGEYDCEIIAPSYGDALDKEGERKYCAGVFHNRSLWVPLIGFRNSVPSSDRKLKKLLDKSNPVLLHAHSPFAICGYFIKYGKKHDIPVVYTFHTKFKDEFMRVTHSRLITAVMMSVIMRNIKKLEYVWAVSASSAQTLRSYGYKGKIKVMRNGTDMRVAGDEERAALSAEINKEYGISPDERVFLFVGRVVSVKNIKFSFRVIAELKKRGFSCKFFVVGGGEEIEPHKKYAEKLGVSDSVIFTGFVGDRGKLRRYYARANLFLLPSVFDNAPLVMLEAASLQTPSLVPAGTSSEELIKNDVTGYAEKLDETLWADKIEKIFSGADYAAVCKGCTSVVYTWEQAVADAEAEYRRIIAEYYGRAEEAEEACGELPAGQNG